MINFKFLEKIKIRYTNYIVKSAKNPWLLLTIFLGFLIRLSLLSDPIRSDEASTFFGYIEPFNPFRIFLFDPNNHFLYTILTKMLYCIFGFSLSTLRIVAFFSGILFDPNYLYYF